MKTARCLLGALLVLAGIGAAMYPQFTEWRYAGAQYALAAEVDALGPATGEQAAAGGRPMPAGTVARLEIARIGLDAHVVEGTDSAQLDRGPGHYTGTPLPGERGTCGIAAHRTMHGHAFRRLDDMRAGDEIVATTTAMRAVYRVVSVRVVDRSDWSIVEQADGYRLVLSTCHPVGSARQRLVVFAEMVSQ